jgi:hypothetical protein
MPYYDRANDQTTNKVSEVLNALTVDELKKTLTTSKKVLLL